MVLCCTLLTALGQLLIKFGVNKAIGDLWSLLNLYIILGLGVYIVAGLLFMTAIQHAELSMLYPLIATSFIWVTIVSYLILNEPLNLMKLGGILCIIIGVACISKT